MNSPSGVDEMLMYGYTFVPPTRGPRDAARRVGVAVFAAVVAFAAGAVFVSAGSDHKWFPSRWDPRVAPIAAEVARLRGLGFDHPVPVRYLTPKAFEKQMGGGSPSASDRAEVTREEAVFRSLGFIGGKVDLLRAFETEQSSGTLAYYDPYHQEIIVRGTALDVSHRVTLAHELTHVLQDQHFDLRKLQKRAADSDTGDASALKALVEGDAVRIENDYLEQLSPAERKQYDREYAAEGARIDKETTSVPDIVGVLSGAPYQFGESTIRVLLESGGNGAVDDALTGPTPSTEVLVESGDVSPPVAVDQPLVPPGAVALGSPETFGPFETYLTLMMRLDPARALAAADIVAGGRAVTFRNRGVTCYRVAVAPAFEHSRISLLRAVRDWAHARPRTTVDAAGDLVGFTTCDPGRGAPNPASTRFHNAIDVLSFRSAITVDAAKGHQSGAFARCVARMFVQHRGAVQLLLAIGNGTPTPEQSAQLAVIGTASGDACRADADSGLQ